MVPHHLGTVLFRWLYRIDPASKRQPLPFHPSAASTRREKKHEFHANSMFSKARCSDLGMGTRMNCKSSSDQPTDRPTDRPTPRRPQPQASATCSQAGRAGSSPLHSSLSPSPTLHLPRIGATLPPCLLSSTNRGRDPSDPAQVTSTPASQAMPIPDPRTEQPACINSSLQAPLLASINRGRCLDAVTFVGVSGHESPRPKSLV